MEARGLKAWVLALALAVVAPAFAGSPKDAVTGGEATVFYGIAKVEIGPAGDIVSVSPDPKFSTAIGAAMERSVRALSFTPAAVDGVPVSGATYVRMMGCAVPAGSDNYRVAFEYKAHGPGMERFPPPSYPADAMRAGISGDFDVRITVQPDGSARLDQLEVIEGGARAKRAFAKSIEAWVASLRYEPEQVGGRFVTTSLSVPLEFHMSHRISPFPPRVDKELESLQAANEQSDACQLAFGRERSREKESVALNSPFTLKPGT